MPSGILNKMMPASSEEAQENPMYEKQEGVKGEMEEAGSAELEQPSEEEQAQYDMIIAQATNFIHTPKATDQFLAQIGKVQQPAQTLGLQAARINLGILESAKRAGTQLTPAAVINANQEIVEELADLALNTGQLKLDSEEEVRNLLEQSMFVATNATMQSAVQAGLLDKNELQRELADTIRKVGVDKSKESMLKFQDIGNRDPVLAGRNKNLPTVEKSRGILASLREALK